MRAVVLRIQTTPNVMKGGTELALQYGLYRDLIALDLDEWGEGSPSRITCEIDFGTGTLL